MSKQENMRMKKEIKEKIIKILREYHNASTDLLLEGISKEKLDACLETDYEFADQILELFEERKKEILKELLKELPEKRNVEVCSGGLKTFIKKKTLLVPMN